MTPNVKRPEYVDPQLFQRFLDKIEVVEECWEWRGSMKYNGYGFFTVYGKLRTAHRVAYEWWVGPLVDGLEINHLCAVRHCVNPEHLEQVTRHENLMKSEGITAQNAQKTRCPQGHPYSGLNNQGRRICRICQRENLRRSRARRR